MIKNPVHDASAFHRRRWLFKCKENITKKTQCVAKKDTSYTLYRWWHGNCPTDEMMVSNWSHDNMIASDMGQCKVRFLLSSQMKGLIFCVIVQKLGKVLGFSKPLSPFIWVLPLSLEICSCTVIENKLLLRKGYEFSSCLSLNVIWQCREVARKALNAGRIRKLQLL